MKLFFEPAIRSPSQWPGPVAGNGAVLHAGRPFPDRDRILDLAKPVALEAGIAGAADRASRPQVRQQLLLEHTTGLDEQASVDRFVRHTCALVIRMLALQPAGDLLRRPLAFELLCYCVTELRLPRQLAGLWPPGPIPGRRFRDGRTIDASTAIATHLPTDR